jgi:hypothetical protein
MIELTVRIEQERTGEGVGAEFKVDSDVWPPRETELRGLSVYICRHIEEVVRGILDRRGGWHPLAPV